MRIEKDKPPKPTWISMPKSPTIEHVFLSYPSSDINIIMKLYYF